MKFFAAILTGLLLVCAGIQSAQAQVPVEDFFRKPRLSGVTLSPDGKHIAFVAPSTKGDDRMVLAMAAVDSCQVPDEYLLKSKRPLLMGREVLAAIVAGWKDRATIC